MESAKNKPYLKLLLMVVFSFISMYILMFAMVDVFANVYPSRNHFYMAAVMTAPMVIIELILMSKMYPSKKRNIVIIAFSTVALIGFFMMIRNQTAIGNEQFLRSMIPHHAGAILMCKESSFDDPEIKKLCEKISAGQQEEIDQMKAILQRLEHK
ncbi:MAG: DUF305 domain-containing protein [Bacteroidetes bacterium]|nr:DUF305 domain-containing protein [Bacteroidota bacterium]